MSTTRRHFFKTCLAGTAGLAFSGIPAAAAADGKRKKIAAIVVRYGLRLHADNLVTRLLEGYWLNDEFHRPSCDVASVYVHHVDSTDISRRLSAAYGFRVSPTIADALTLGTDGLAVDGVLIVSEDAFTYWTENPFFSFFSQVMDVFRRSGRAVPVLNDKALSHDWDEAQWMVRQSRRLGFPMIAGSTTPVTFRRPQIDFPRGTRFTEALVVATIPKSYVESLAFHGLELLQCVTERRPGGETGIRAVQCLEGPAVWAAARDGLWSRELFDAAAARSHSRSEGRPEDLIADPLALLVEYVDGTRGAVIGAAGLVRDFNFACRVHGEPEVKSFAAYIPWENSNNFGGLVHYFERMLASGRPDFPVERTMLNCGTLDFLMRSRREGHQRLLTPALAKVHYEAPAVSAFLPGAGS